MPLHHSATACSPRLIWYPYGPILKEQLVEKPFFPCTRSFLLLHEKMLSSMSYSRYSTHYE